MTATARSRALLTAALFGLAFLVAVPAEARPARPASPVARDNANKKGGQKGQKASRPAPQRSTPPTNRATRPAPAPSRTSPPSRPAPPSRAAPARPPPAPSRGHAASAPRPAPVRGHAASPVPSRGSSGHAATPVYPPRGHAVYTNCCPDHYPRYWASYSHSHVHVYSDPYVQTHSHVVTRSEPAPSSNTHAEFMGMVQPTLGGLGMNLALLIDGENLGLDLRAERLVFADEIPGLRGHGMNLFDVGMTGRIFGGERGRLRAHLGITSGFSRDVTYLAPYGGVSATARILGPLTTEASAQLALVPYTRLDTRAGLGLRFGVVEVRGGARMLVLDDQGRVTGEHNTDVLMGPYVSAGLVF